MGYTQNVYKVNNNLVKGILPKLKKLGIESTFIIPHGDWLESQLQLGHEKFLPLQDPEKVKRAIEGSNNKGTIVRRCFEIFKKRRGFLYITY